MAKKWTAFPHAGADYAYAGAALKKAWSRLHQGDREPFPKEAAVADAWRHFHAGEFQQAVEAGRKAQGPGVNAAVKAQSVYANHLERDARRPRAGPTRDAPRHLGTRMRITCTRSRSAATGRAYRSPRRWRRALAARSAMR